MSYCRNFYTIEAITLQVQIFPESETVQKFAPINSSCHGQKLKNIKGADLNCIYSCGKKIILNWFAALESGIPTLERSEMLGVVTAHYQGLHCRFRNTHGKLLRLACLHNYFYKLAKILPLLSEKAAVHRKQWPCR